MAKEVTFQKYEFKFSHSNFRILKVCSVLSTLAIVADSSENANNSDKFVITGWNLLAQAIDRILFVLYVLIVFIFLGAYLGGATVIIDKFTK